MAYSRGTPCIRSYSDVVRSDSNSSSLHSHQPTSSPSTPNKSSTTSSTSTSPPLNALTAPKRLELGYKAHGRYARGLRTGIQTSKHLAPLIGLGMPSSAYNVASWSGATNDGSSDSTPAQAARLATSSTASSFASTETSLNAHYVIYGTSRDSEDPADVHHYDREDYVALRAARKGKSKVASCSCKSTSAPTVGANAAASNVAPNAVPSPADLESLMSKMTYKEHYYTTEFSDGCTQLDFYRRPTKATLQAAQDGFDEECRQKALALRKEETKARASLMPELIEGLDYTIIKSLDGRIERHFHHEAGKRAWEAEQDRLNFQRLKEERRQHVLALEKKLAEAERAGLLPEVTYFADYSIVSDGRMRREFYNRLGKVAYYREQDELEDERRRALAHQREEEAKQRLEDESRRERTDRWRAWRNENLRLAAEREYFRYIEYMRQMEWNRHQAAMQGNYNRRYLQEVRRDIEERERDEANMERWLGARGSSSEEMVVNETTLSRESTEEWTSLMSGMTSNVDDETRPEFRAYAEKHSSQEEPVLKLRSPWSAMLP
ncbi:hypothetical protein LTR95_005201 [Oleoguttula sp. CCFEE 5521]